MKLLSILLVCAASVFAQQEWRVIADEPIYNHGARIGHKILLQSDDYYGQCAVWRRTDIEYFGDEQVLPGEPFCLTTAHPPFYTYTEPRPRWHMNVIIPPVWISPYRPSDRKFHDDRDWHNRERHERDDRDRRR